MRAKEWFEGTVQSLESLPVELQRNFKLMRDLDGRAQSIMQEIDLHGDEYLRTCPNITSERKRELSQKNKQIIR